jgi:hypothetical protein
VRPREDLILSDLGLDFGLFVAYFIPGVIGLIGLTYFSAGAREILDGITGKEMSTGGFLVGAIVVLILGMSLSILRFATIDASFRVAIPCLAPPMKRINPNFENLITEGRLSAYNEAKAADKRPYQFYGNTLLALILVAVGILLRAPHSLKRRILFAFGIIVTGLVVLYPAARESHFRFMETVIKMNQLPPVEATS